MLNRSTYSAFRQMMIACVTVLLVSLMGGVQAEIGKSIVPSPSPTSPEIQVIANKLAEIESVIEQGDINAAQATLQDAMDWVDRIAIYFYIDGYNPSSSGCQNLFLHFPNSPPNIGVNLPCMLLAPVVSLALANGIYIYYYTFLM